MNRKLIRILHVDDEPDVLNVVKTSLSSCDNFSVECCSSGQAAVALCIFFRPDLVLMDNLMPDLDGLETMKKIRQLPALAQTPVIFLTAKADSSDIKNYENLGAIGIIAKPFDPLTLPHRIRSLLGENLLEGDPFIDVSLLQEFRSIVDEQFSMLVQTYVKDGQRYIREIHQALESNDMIGAKMRAHTLKSSSGYLGALVIKRIAEQIDELDDDSPIEEAARIAAPLIVAFQKTKEALSSYI